jgi:hypothetical protein
MFFIQNYNFSSCLVSDPERKTNNLQVFETVVLKNVSEHMKDKFKHLDAIMRIMLK